MLLVFEPDLGSPLADAIAAAGEQRGVEVLRWSPTAMVESVSLALTIDGGGAAVRFSVDGRAIRGDDLDGVVTLIDGFTPELWPKYTPRDREYAATEALASWVALLTALPCPLLNPPAPDALGGAVYPPVEVSMLAAKVGLSTPSILYLDSAASFRDERADELRASACALGHLPLAEVPLGQAWLDEAGSEPIRIRGVGEARIRAVIVGERVLEVGDVAPPEEIKRALIDLHRRIRRPLGEVWLGRDEDGRWLLEDAMRWPSAAALEFLGERLGASIVTACTEGRRW